MFWAPALLRVAWLLLGLVLLTLKRRNAPKGMLQPPLLMVDGCTARHEALQPLPSSADKRAAAAAAVLDCC